MSKSLIVLVPWLAALVLTSVPVGAASVSAPSVGSSLTISLSGNESVSHSTSVDFGDTFSIVYALTSMNETSCVSTSVSFESATGLSQLIFANRTSMLPHLTRVNGTSFTVNYKGTVVVTYSGCSNPCKGSTLISSNYSVGADLYQRYMRTGLMWAPFLVSILAVGLVVGYFFARNRFKNWWKQGKFNPPTPGVAPARH